MEVKAEREELEQLQKKTEALMQERKNIPSISFLQLFFLVLFILRTIGYFDWIPWSVMWLPLILEGIAMLFVFVLGGVAIGLSKVAKQKLEEMEKNTTEKVEGEKDSNEVL